jgi:alpha-tubulin suppressor-like RCC1 family protein
MPQPYLTPTDAFETFDESKIGFIDEDEFFYCFEYLGVTISDEVHEKLFSKYDLDNTGSVDYEEFREAFLEVCDLRTELENRGIDAPALTLRSTLMRMLHNALVEEEIKERRALAEAIRYKKWIMSVRDKRKVLQHAGFRAYQELRTSLDLGGHVYVFGGGTHLQFSENLATKLKSKQFTFDNFERIIELWKDRIQPAQLVDRLRLDRKVEEQEAKRDAERNLGGLAADGALKPKKTVIDPYLEALGSLFDKKNVAMNTAALWGRRVHSVAISDSVLFAITDTGEIYTWGGNNHWWHEIQPDSLFQTTWRGDTTPRSQLLLGTVGKTIPTDTSLENVALDAMTEDEKKAELIKVICKYYGCYEPPPNAGTKMHFLEKELLPKISYDDLIFSLGVRGKKIENMTKFQLCEELYEDILLEKKLLGERAHKAIKELEVQVTSLRKRKKMNMADKVLQRVVDMWAPLREVQAEERAASMAKKIANEQYSGLKKEEAYINWRHRMTVKREDLDPKYTPRGNSLTLELSGVTPRGPDLSTPRGFQAAKYVSAGSSHAAIVHKTGQLYCWGVGAAGRLGLDLTEAGDPQKDVTQPRLVQALAGRPVLRVSCGYSHTAAIVAGGELYMWGSAAAGKCGLGKIVDREECYCSVPTKVLVGAEDRRIRKVSCGANHSAVVSELGHLYVFGCGDSGRLGLGPGSYDTRYAPTLVECLLHEKVASVSCGSSTTLVCTEIAHSWEGEDGARLRMMGGGNAYMAGALIVLGKQCDVFEQIVEVRGKPVKQVSAGYHHSTLVTAEGEVYAWGRNKRGCCGIPSSVQHFIQTPTLIDCLFSMPKNLAIGKRAYQCSVFNNRDAQYAVDGITEGNGLKQCSCTQSDPQSWIEIDLGQIAIVDMVKLWNRSDMPKDSYLPRDYFSSRLFPCWVMVGQEPFDTELTPYALRSNLKKAMAKVRFSEDHRLSQWRLPSNTQIRYVRVQLEGLNTLCLAQVEVFGHWGIARSVGRVSQAIAGRDVTVCVVRPSQDPRDIEQAYKRAAYCDALNADILRQFETYVLEYDKFGRGEVLIGNECVMCRGKEKCEICNLYDIYGDEIKKMPPQVGGKRPSLKLMEEFLIETNKPAVVDIMIPKKVRPTKWQLRKQGMRKFFGLKNTLKANINNMTVEEANELDPGEIMTDIKSKERHPDAASHGAASESSFSKTFGKKAKQARPNRNDGKLYQNDGSNDNVSIPSLGNSLVDPEVKPKRDKEFHRSQKAIARAEKAEQEAMQKAEDLVNRPVLNIGDQLATGHVVRGAYPRSIIKQSDIGKNH